MQLDGEDLYYLYILMTISAKSAEELEKNIQKIEGTLIGVGVTTRRGTYRQIDALNSCLPFLNLHKNIKSFSKRNVLSSGIVATYPFVTNELCDENGVLIGTNSESGSIVMIDRFETNKYKNANMCIIGTSGSRKILFYKIACRKK